MDNVLDNSILSANFFVRGFDIFIYVNAVEWQKCEKWESEESTLFILSSSQVGKMKFQRQIWISELLSA